MSLPKLYYSPLSSGAASFIAAHTADLKFDSEQVNFYTHVTASGQDFYKINPKGNLPTLVMGDIILNEGSAVLQWIADQNPSAKLAPASGTIDRYLLQNHLNFIATELHKGFELLFDILEEKVPQELRSFFLSRLYVKFDYLENHMLRPGKCFLLGDNFTIADAYLYIVLKWHSFNNVSLDKYPNIQTYYKGIQALPNVQAAEQQMQLLPAAHPERI